ncbi:MAG: TonB-dependent receptor [Pseudomonadota bacterium]
MFGVLRNAKSTAGLCVITTLVCCAPGVMAESQSEAKEYTVSIASGSLSQALINLGSELKISLFFAEETVENQLVEDLSGSYTLSEIFQHLLRGKCLEHDFIRPTLIAITPGGCPRPETPEPTQKIAAIPAPSQTPSVPVENLIVREQYLTGSRIRQAEYGVRMPLDIIDQTEIRLSGFQDVGELLRYVPAVSGNSTSTLISNGGDGTATVTLRGLPANNTLVLLNGRRLNSDALRGQSVDLNTLPLGLVDQIEILKDGVSAIYGSDAVAGVVNIITRQDFDGLSIQAYSGQSRHSDRDTRNLSLTFGRTSNDLGAWYIAGGVTYYDQEGVLSRDRSLSATSDDRSRGGIDKRSSATSPARIGTSAGTWILQDGTTGALATDFRPATSEDRFEYRDFTSSIVPSERISAFLQGQMTFGEWESYVDVLYTETQATSYLAPTPIFTAFEIQPIVVSATQPFNPFGETITDLRRRVTELPHRVQVNETESYRLISGLRRGFSNVNFDMAMQFNQTDAIETFHNGINLANLSAAVSDGCLAPCVPINLFGPPGSITSTMLDWVGTDATLEGRSQLMALTFDVDWLAATLSTGDVEVSAGFEYRYESLESDPDAILSNQLLAGGGNRSAVKADRDIFEVYAELLLPLTEVSSPQRLDLQLATRISRYADFGFQVNPRAAITWQPLDALTVRSSVARGFRAPSLLQLFGSTLQSFKQLNDPCSQAQNVTSFVGCDILSDPTLTQFLTLSGGESSLEPERSTTYSLGAVWQPKLSKRHDLVVSADWYLIEQKDVVDSSAQFVINQDARLGAFPDRVFRNADGNISQVLATLQNIGRREVSGVDVTASWQFDAEAFGRFTLALNGSHIFLFKDKFDPDSPTIDKAGTFSDEASGGLGALPEWKWNLGLSWEYGHWQAYYNIYRVSDLEEVVPIVMRERTISSWTTQNLNVSYLGPMTGWIRTTIGVNNLFDQAPPFSAAAFNDSYDGRTYDITGRYLFLNLTKQF